MASFCLVLFSFVLREHQGLFFVLREHQWLLFVSFYLVLF